MSVPTTDRFLTVMTRGDLGLPVEPFRQIRCKECNSVYSVTDSLEYARWNREVDATIRAYNAKRAREREGIGL